MATTGDPSETLALAIRLGVAKEGEPMTPLMSMLTVMKDYAEHVEIGAFKGTQASWASCIPHAEKLLDLERKALEALRAKAVEWDSKLSSRTGELAELDARFEQMSQETARAGEQLLDANQKQSEATKQLARTLERTRIAEENHAKDEQRLKLKEDLLTTYSDQLEKREASSASKEARLKHMWEELETRESKMAATQKQKREELEARESKMTATQKQKWEELEARESKMAAIQKHARESDTRAEGHLNAIRSAHLTLRMLTEKTGLPATELSAHELVVDLQGLTSDIQDQIANLKDQIAHLNDIRITEEEEQAKAHQIGNRELKVLRDDVAAKASIIKKAELGAADYKSKLESLQATSSQRIHELELSSNNLLNTKNSLEGRLLEALQNHKEMVAEYAKYKALERTESALNKQIQYIEGRLQGVERQRNDAVAANRTFEIENARLQKFEHAHRLNEKEIGQYINDRDREMSELRAEVEASKTEARRLAKHCEDLKSEGVTNAKNAATNVERLQVAHRDEVSRMGRISDARILELEEMVKRQEEQLKDAEKLATEQGDNLRKAENLNTSLYNTLKDGASAIELANKCRMEHHDFEDLKRRSSELQAQVERSIRARTEDREADIQTIKSLKSEKAVLQHEVSRFNRINLENRTKDSRTIKTLESRIAQLEFEKTEGRKTDVQTIEAQRSQNANTLTEVERLRHTITENQETNAQTIKTLEGRIAQLGSEKIEDRKRDVQTMEALGSENADLQTEVERLSRTISKDREISAQTIKTLKGRVTQLELEKAEDQKTIEALRSQNADSQTEVERLSGRVSEYKDAISEYTKTHSETVKGLEGRFVQYEAKIKELQSAEAEATKRATTSDHKLHIYQETIKRLRSERDEAREEIELANATHATALDDARQARHELESPQQRVTPDNPNGQTANKKVRRKRPADEMLEEDMPVVPVVPAVGHAYNLQEIRDPDFTDPNIPSDVLDKLHSQFARWDEKSGQEWARQMTRSRCVEVRCARITAKHLHGNEYACDYCEDRRRVCVVIRQAGIVNLLPVHQDGEAVGPEDESYWTK